MVLFGLTLNSEDTFQTDVVRKKANCTSCHIGFNFTDEKFHNLGVGWDDTTGKFADLGLWAIAPIGAKNDAEIGAFKTPTLRDLERTAPYMHDGSEKTLEEIVEYYDRGGNANPALDPDMKKLNLTAQEKADLVAFLKSLTGEPLKVALPTLPPGPDGQRPDPAAALKPPAAPKAAALGTLHLGVVR
jgi:cytochrome c peroxidase